MYKVIIKGFFDFGNPTSYEKAFRTFLQRLEVYYKHDILLKEEESFYPEQTLMEVPRIVTSGADKTVRNTVHMLNMMADYAWSGIFNVWVINDKGDLVAAHYIEPRTDRGSVMDYLNGRELMKQHGRENEAIALFNNTLAKFDRHSRALERRAKAYYRLHNYSAAMEDYNRSIEINANSPEPFVGRAILKKENNDFEGAIADLEVALANSIPHQTVYWHARQLKGECHFLRAEFEKAVFDLKFFTKRAFKKDDPNYCHRHSAFRVYGKALLETGAVNDAISAFNNAIELNENDPGNAETLLYRGIARHRLGSAGFDQDLKAAAKLGSAQAKEFMEKISFQYN